MIAAVQGIAYEQASDRVGEYAGLLAPYALYRGISASILDTSVDAITPPQGALMETAYVAVSLLIVLGGIAMLDLALSKGGGAVSTLELANASRWYGNVVAVNDITMQIGPGVTGLLGPNGAGKSTLIAMMSGFLPHRRARPRSTASRSGRTPTSTSRSASCRNAKSASDISRAASS